MHESNTPQQLGRSEPVTRDAAWEVAFTAQLTHDLAESVASYAKGRASWVEAIAKRKDHGLWRELYQDALTDTWTGTVTWDPARAPLDLHLKGVIRSRTSKAMRHLTRFPRIEAHAPDLELEQEMSEAIAAERTCWGVLDVQSYVDRVISALYELATGDKGVVQILDCFGQKLIDRRDLLRVTGMTATTYSNARRRLLGLVKRLPDDLRDDDLRAA
jgi:hypothetical protein